MNTLIAIKTGNIGLIQERIVTRQIHKEFQYHGVSALHLAVLYGQKDITKILIDAGAEVNLQSTEDSENILGIVSNSTPIHLSVIPKRTDIFLLLIEAKALLNVSNANNEIPLTLAIKHEAMGIISILIKEKAYNADNEEEMKTLLSFVIEKGNYEVGKALIGPEVQVNYKLNNGKSLLLLAVEKNNTNFVELLLNAKADTNFCYYNSKAIKITALSTAIEQNSIAIVAQLIAADAEVNFFCCQERSRISNRGNKVIEQEAKTLLDIAIEKGLVEITSMLIEAGADFNSKFYGNGALFSKAVKYGDKGILKVMLEHGVKKDILNSVLNSYFSSPSIKQCIEQLNQEIISARLENNKIVLINFMDYLAHDQHSNIFSFDKNILQQIAEYGADSETRLNLQECDNYIKYHPIAEQLLPIVGDCNP